MEVDWAGGTLPITDPLTGETVSAYLFVSVLPCSCYAYAELCSDMQSENWLLCHVHAYEYFGGVPRLPIPDNLRTGVTKNTRLDTIQSQIYRACGSLRYCNRPHQSESTQGLSAKKYYRKFLSPKH